jgi:hypothetical protein
MDGEQSQEKFFAGALGTTEQLGPEAVLRLCKRAYLG